MVLMCLLYSNLLIVNTGLSLGLDRIINFGTLLGNFLQIIDMMYKLLYAIVFLIFLGVGFSSVAQEEVPVNKMNIDGQNYILHPVKPGETLYSIGKKYGVEGVLILNHNPQLVTGLKSGDTLKIPVDVKAEPSVVAPPVVQLPESFTIHQVKRRETLYSISRQYGVTMDDILRLNPGMGQLRRGDKIKIPQVQKAESPSTVVFKADETSIAQSQFVIHEVVAGETLYAISRKYGTDVQSIQDLNPEVVNLRPGVKLKVPRPESKQEDSGLTTPGMVEMIQHTITSGETLYSITRKYQVTAEKLTELNPELAHSFKTGTVIRIPVKVASEAEPDEFVEHIVQPGETKFSLSKKYSISEDQLMKWNSFLSYRGLIAGDVVRLMPGVPVTAGVETPVESLSLSDCENHRIIRKRDAPVSIALMLPLMIDANNLLNLNSDQGHGYDISGIAVTSDSVQVIQPERRSQTRFQGNSENFIHFYEGALLAIQSLKEEGIPVRLEVFDTEQRESRIRNLLSSGQLQNSDLIIGPVYPDELKVVGEFSNRLLVPVVSPLSQSEEITRKNPLMYQVNPARQTVAEKTAEYILKNYREHNLILVRMGNQESPQEAEWLRYLNEKSYDGAFSRPAVRICDFRKLGINGLRSMLMPDRKNVIMLPTQNEAEVSVGVSNIHTLAPNFDITIIGSNRYQQFESINQEYFHDGQLEYLAPYWPEYTAEITRSFVRRFRDYFKTEPNQYSMQGYDVTYFFGKAVYLYGSDFSRCLNTLKLPLVQGNYHFAPTPSGGYINEGLHVISFTRDYKVVRKEVQLQ